MSISDQIVLMELGEKQQVGEPQYVYDYPENLFVAKFLGTPPINIFDGVVENGNLLIGDSKLKKIKTDQKDVVVGIRPEGFLYVEKGTLHVEVYQVETIGRDTTLIVKDPSNEGKTFRVIIDSQYRVKPGDVVGFDIRPEKLFVFNKETGALI